MSVDAEFDEYGAISQTVVLDGDVSNPVQISVAIDKAKEALKERAAQIGIDKYVIQDYYDWLPKWVGSAPKVKRCTVYLRPIN